MRIFVRQQQPRYTMYHSRWFTGDMRRKAKLPTSASFTEFHYLDCQTTQHSRGRQRTDRRLLDLFTHQALHGRMHPSYKEKDNRGSNGNITFRISIPGIPSYSGYAERTHINAYQGSAADIIKIAMIRIYKRFEKEKAT